MILAGLAHGAALAAVHAAAFPAEEAWGREFFATQLVQPGVFALTDGVGGFVMVRVAADEAEVMTIAVHPERQARGVGRRLLEAACAEAGRCGAAAIFLEVSDRNAVAEGLYRSVGFAQVGRRARYYPDGSAALVMRLALRPDAG